MSSAPYLEVGTSACEVLSIQTDAVNMSKQIFFMVTPVIVVKRVVKNAELPRQVVCHRYHQVRVNHRNNVTFLSALRKVRINHVFVLNAKSTIGILTGPLGKVSLQHPYLDISGQRAPVMIKPMSECIGQRLYQLHR